MAGKFEIIFLYIVPQLSSEATALMPAPMAPLSFQRYQPTFQYPQPPSWNNNSGPRSFDDVDIALSHRNPERILVSCIRVLSVRGSL